VGGGRGPFEKEGDNRETIVKWGKAAQQLGKLGWGKGQRRGRGKATRGRGRKKEPENSSLRKETNLARPQKRGSFYQGLHGGNLLGRKKMH